MRNSSLLVYFILSWISIVPLTSPPARAALDFGHAEFEIRGSGTQLTGFAGITESPEPLPALLEESIGLFSIKQRPPGKISVPWTVIREGGETELETFLQLSNASNRDSPMEVDITFFAQNGKDCTQNGPLIVTLAPRESELIAVSSQLRSPCP